MIIALATPRPAPSLNEGLETTRRLLTEAAQRGASIVCFPEAYLPGLRGLDFPVAPFGPEDQHMVLHAVSGWTRELHVAALIGMEWIGDAGSEIAAVLIDREGRVVGHQSKIQLDPAEERFYVPGTGRRLFEVDGVTFGVSICHEGFRYPETVRWAAARGAKVVFHPHCTGSDRTGTVPPHWGAVESPYYEKAMMCRGLENNIYFASVNYAFRHQESATTLIDPEGRCQAYLPYGQEGVLVAAVDPDAATGLLASRYAPERYRE